MGLIQYVTGVLIEEGNLDMDTERTSCEDTEGNCDDMAFAVTSHGASEVPRISKRQKDLT